jgi:hypothetical protein
VQYSKYSPSSDNDDDDDDGLVELQRNIAAITLDSGWFSFSSVIDLKSFDPNAIGIIPVIPDENFKYLLPSEQMMVLVVVVIPLISILFEHEVSSLKLEIESDTSMLNILTHPSSETHIKLIVPALFDTFESVVEIKNKWRTTVFKSSINSI